MNAGIKPFAGISSHQIASEQKAASKMRRLNGFILQKAE
jgi:hypothetical protein